MNDSDYVHAILYNVTVWTAVVLWINPNAIDKSRDLPGSPCYWILHLFITPAPPSESQSTAVQSQMAVTAYVTSEQLLPFGFTVQV